LHILFVDNHARFARIVSQQFLSSHEVTVVPSPAAARSALQQRSFQVVLLDYDLDDCKGDELVRELSTLEPPPKLVAVSSHDAGNTAIFSAGADAICSKMQFAHIAEVLDAVESDTQTR
jgi:CheY-like chemotaxis protein